MPEQLHKSPELCIGFRAPIEIRRAVMTAAGTVDPPHITALSVRIHPLDAFNIRSILGMKELQRLDIHGRLGRQNIHKVRRYSKRTELKIYSLCCSSQAKSKQVSKNKTRRERSERIYSGVRKVIRRCC